MVTARCSVCSLTDAVAPGSPSPLGPAGSRENAFSVATAGARCGYGAEQISERFSARLLKCSCREYNVLNFGLLKKSLGLWAVMLVTFRV